MRFGNGTREPRLTEIWPSVTEEVSKVSTSSEMVMKMQKEELLFIHQDGKENKYLYFLNKLIEYSRKNLKMGHEYMKTLKPGSAAHTFCEIPLALAEATVTIIEQGLPKVILF